MATRVDARPAALSNELRSFLAGTPPRYAVIGVANRDGSPHQNVIWYLPRDEGQGLVFVLNSRRGRHWPTSLEREGVCSLAVHDGEQAVVLRCVLLDEYDGERAHADAEEMARRYDPPERANPRIERFRTEDRVSFVLRATSVRTHGDPR